MTSDNALWLRIGDSDYALPLDKVRYIIPIKDIRLQTFPTSKVPLWGLLVYNGQLIPVLKIDFLPPNPHSKTGYYVVYYLINEWVAIWVDECIGFRQFEGTFLDLSPWRLTYET